MSLDCSLLGLLLRSKTTLMFINLTLFSSPLILIPARAAPEIWVPRVRVQITKYYYYYYVVSKASL
jgi:hypothetical protein